MVKIDVAKTLNLEKMINAGIDEVVSMKIFNKKNNYISLFALDTNEVITAETMLGHRYYYCLSGSGEIIVEEVSKKINIGDFFEVDNNKSYSIKSLDKFKIIEVGEKIGGTNMKNKILKSLASAEALKIADTVTYQENKIISKNLVANTNLVMTVMAFSKGESLEPHIAPGDALINVLDGEGKFFVDEKEFIVKKGESAVLPANIPHAVEAIENFKMLLILVK